MSYIILVKNVMYYDKLSPFSTSLAFKTRTLFQLNYIILYLYYYLITIFVSTNSLIINNINRFRRRNIMRYRFYAEMDVHTNIKFTAIGLIAAAAAAMMTSYR